MAVNRSPILKRCRTLGISPAVLGYDKESNRKPGGAKQRKKLSGYGAQLKEKQKVKFIYGVLEKQFYHYYELAERKEGVTGENLLQILECRLDNVVWRMGMASTRREARQLVTHNHFTINGKKANIPSIIIKQGDVIALASSSRDSEKFKALIELMETKTAPKWLEVDKANASAKAIALPSREDVDFPFEEHLIVELYSK